MVCCWDPANARHLKATVASVCLRVCTINLTEQLMWLTVSSTQCVTVSSSNCTSRRLRPTTQRCRQATRPHIRLTRHSRESHRHEQCSVRYTLLSVGIAKLTGSGCEVPPSNLTTTDRNLTRRLWSVTSTPRQHFCKLRYSGTYSRCWGGCTYVNRCGGECCRPINIRYCVGTGCTCISCSK